VTKETRDTESQQTPQCIRMQPFSKLSELLTLTISTKISWWYLKQLRIIVTNKQPDAPTNGY